MARGARSRWVACAAVDQPSTTTSATAPEPEPAQPEGSTGAASTASAGSVGFLARGRVRRRARFLRKARELAYRDLGGLVFNLHRFGKRNDALVLAKLSTIARIDGELRGLESALGESRRVTVLREAGVTACPRCAAIHSSEDRFCPSCGLPLTGRADLPIATAAGQTPAVTAARASTIAGTPPVAPVPAAAESSPGAEAPSGTAAPAPGAASEPADAAAGTPADADAATGTPAAAPPVEQTHAAGDAQARDTAAAGRSPRPPRRTRPGAGPGAGPDPAAAAPDEPPATAVHSSARAPAAGTRPLSSEEEPTEIVPPAAADK